MGIYATKNGPLFIYKNGLSNEERQVEFGDFGDYTSQLHAGLLKNKIKDFLLTK